MKKFEKTTETQNTETQNVEIKNRQMQFNRLLNASHEARQIKTVLIQKAPSQAMAAYYATLPLNHFLLNFVYKTEGITDFKKFGEWKQTGASVKKGEKAFPIWGQPVGAQKEERAEEKGETYQATDEENRRFPICYVFSNLQVRTAAVAAEGGAVC